MKRWPGAASPLHLLNFYTFIYLDGFIGLDPFVPPDFNLQDLSPIFCSRIILIAPKRSTATGIAISPVSRQSKLAFPIAVHC